MLVLADLEPLVVLEVQEGVLEGHVEPLRPLVEHPKQGAVVRSPEIELVPPARVRVREDHRDLSAGVVHVAREAVVDLEVRERVLLVREEADEAAHPHGGQRVVRQDQLLQRLVVDQRVFQHEPGPEVAPVHAEIQMGQARVVGQVLEEPGQRRNGLVGRRRAICDPELLQHLVSPHVLAEVAEDVPLEGVPAEVQGVHRAAAEQPGQALRSRESPADPSL
mmetsp:Transcript_70468/g.184765  ORF Transcript_70468/g.184765 Transcript_70468/m.184765 type:complete len:221 (-) Transcript_70468:1250-1912(-)